MTAYWLERAAVDGVVRDSVRVEIEDGLFTAVEVGAEQAGADRLAGLTIPGLANCHSHAFHRALRGRTQQDRGTFWTWREQMYAVAGRLDPDSYYDLARATYREMLAAGFTSVGEFHYLHHGPDGTPYSDANAMGLALVEAARDAGIRIALLDTCYLAAGIGREPEGVQRRFTDGDAGAWAARTSDLCRGVTSSREHGGSAGGSVSSAGAVDVVVGAAIHSVRAVPRDQMHFVAEWADRHQAPLHVHVSEQLSENVTCLEAYGETPTGVLEDAGVLGPRTTAVHATHLTDADVRLLGETRTHVCFCPTTERDLADGIGPSRLLHEAGARLTLGTDSHAVIDAFEEMRAVELDERLSSQERGQWSAAELLEAASSKGHRSLGFDGAGRIAVGAPADLVTLDVRSPRTAGTGSGVETAVFAASAADVVRVVAQGKVVVERGDHRDIGVALDRAVHRIWED
jgi:formiminoglutamate deiminase